MADLIKKVKIKKQDETYTDYIPIGAEAKNVDCADGESVEYKINKKPYYYNCVADMKADTKLKVGDMAVTLGYYEPNDGGAAEYRIINNSEDYYEILDNSLKAELIIKENTLNMLSLGVKRNVSSFNSTSLLQNAIDKSKGYILYFPYGKYYFTNIIVLIGQHNIKIHGDNAFGRDFRTIFLPYKNMEGTMFTIGDATTTIDNIVYGFEMKNLCIKGEGVTRPIMNAISLGRTSNVLFENLSIYYLNGYAILMDGVYDSIFNNVEINVAGNTTTAALIMKGSVTATNAIRYNNCRIEACIRYLHIMNNVFQLMFNETKFEDNRDSSSTSNMILIEDEGDITFTNCLFTSKNGPEDYLIKLDNNDYKTSVRFVGCNFQCSGTNSNGGKYIDTTSTSTVANVIITNCFFSFPNTRGAIKLNKSTFCNNTIFPHTMNDSTNTHIIDVISDNVIENNVFLGNNGSYPAFAYKLGGTGNIIKNTKYQSWNNKKLIDNISIYGDNSLDFRLALPTGTSISSNTIDAIQSSFINIPSNTTVEYINNAWVGCELYLYSNGNNVVIDFTNIPLIYNYISSLTIPGGRVAVLRKISDTAWILVSTTT